MALRSRPLSMVCSGTFLIDTTQSSTDPDDVIGLRRSSGHVVLGNQNFSTLNIDIYLHGPSRDALRARELYSLTGSFIDDLAEEGPALFVRPEQVIHLRHADIMVREMTRTVGVTSLGVVASVIRGTRYVWADVEHSEHDPRYGTLNDSLVKYRYAPQDDHYNCEWMFREGNTLFLSGNIIGVIGSEAGPIVNVVTVNLAHEAELQDESEPDSQGDHSGDENVSVRSRSMPLSNDGEAVESPCDRFEYDASGEEDAI